MPPKRGPKKVEKVDRVESDSESDSEAKYELKELKELKDNTQKNDMKLVDKTVGNQRLPMMLKSSNSDSDRVQLAHAINNMNLKADQLMEAMRGFDKFREEVAQLDIKLDIKRSEYNQTIEELDNNYEKQKRALDESYEERSKKLENKYKDLNRNMENEYNEKNKELQNNYKNTQIEVKQKLAEFKVKACEDLAKEFNMLLIKNDEYKVLQDNVSKANKELQTLQQSFTDQCNAIRNEEKNKYNESLKIQNTTSELNNKAIMAELKAQVEQQKKEINVLSSTIENLKHELSEQRNLTKEVAQASSKAQITQNLGSNQRS